MDKYLIKLNTILKVYLQLSERGDTMMRLCIVLPQ